MRKFGKESAAPAVKGADRDKSGNGWLRSHWCALSLLVIVIVAFVLRFAMAYGVSADGDYALSGGSSAQYHLHVIESILAGSWSLTDMSVNYPLGGSLTVPPLLDFIAAGVASLFAGSMGDTVAASFALGVLAPIFGALTCIPVYMIGKEMFDKTIGVVAALIFAFLALPISSTVFSNGTEYGLAAFLLSFMVYFAVRMVKAADAEDDSRRGLLINAVLAGVLLALAALTWNGFRFVVVLFVVAMVLQAVVSRISGKDFTGITIGYAVTILIGTLVPALYYVPAGLMDTVYSGPLLIAIVSVVFAFAFLALRAKPWVVTLPALVVVFIVLCVAMAIGASDLFNDFFFGNSVYTGILEEVASSRLTMSSLASYYGWMTMWLPLCLAAYETYVFLKKDHSQTRLFVAVWLFVMFFASWTSYGNAAVVGSVFAVGSAGAIVLVFRELKVRDWLSGIRAAGLHGGGLRKILKPFPLASVLVVALLVVVPNASFAVDAGQSTNTEGDHYYTGNTNFTIATGDSYPVGDIWEHYEDIPTDGALVTWIDYVYDAVAHGGFSTVADTTGGGLDAASAIYTADGSAGAVAAMMLRLLMSDPDRDYSSCFGDNADVYRTIAGYIDDPSSAMAAITSDPETYGNVRSDITDENAVYLAGIEAMLTAMNEKEISEAYDAVCDLGGNEIGYVLVDGSMLPLQYGDGSSFSTIAYFAGYSLNSYGAATEFYSYNLYTGATTYTSEIYDTLIWKALIGPSATEAGYSSSYNYLVALANSDGTTKAIPGYGLTGFEVAVWLVLYNPDSEASLSDDGWVYMDGWEAMALQEEQGGLIDYLAGYVMLEYVGVPDDASVLEGSVTSDAGEAIDGATVAVYRYSDVYDDYILYSQTTTRDGVYEAIVPSGDYRIDVMIGDLVVESSSSESVSADVTVQSSTVEGSVMVGDQVYDGESMMLHLESDADEADFEITDGTFTLEGILPGTYSYVLYGEGGTSLGTGSVTVYPGESVGFVVTPTTRTITVTVQDIHGTNIDGTAYDETPIVVATSTTTGAQFQAEVDENGQAVITVISGRYTLSMGNGLVAITSTTQNASSSNRTATITAYESMSVEVENAPEGVLNVYAGSFSTVTYQRDGGVYFDIPVGLATDAFYYNIYGISGNLLYYGVYEGTMDEVGDDESVSLYSSRYHLVSGTIMDGGSALDGATVEIYGYGFRVAVITDEDGNFSAYVPEGTYTVFAHTNSQLYLGSVAVTGDQDLGDLTTDDSRRVTATIRYDTATSSGNENLPFVKAIIQFTYNDVDYEMVSMTNTSGVAYFYLPDGIEGTVYFNNLEGTLVNDYFTCSELSGETNTGTSNTSVTRTLEWNEAEGEEETDQDYYVNKVPYTSPYDMEVVFYGDSGDEYTLELSEGEEVMLCPGQYDISIDGSTGYYFDGTAYLYVGSTDFVGLEPVEVAVVNIDSAERDSISIESEGSYHSFSDGYYFEIGYDYYLVSTATESGDDGTRQLIEYGYLDLTDAAAGDEFSIDMTATAEAIEVTGSIGVEADGTLTVESESGFRYVFDIDEGAYTMTLPEDVGTVTATAEATEGDSYFTATAEFSDMVDGSVRNLAVLSDEEEADEDETEPELEVDIVSAHFADGRATVEFTITNNTDSAMTYHVTPGSAWSLDRACSVTVQAGQTETRTVTGYYDADRVAPGLDGVTLVVSDINGSNSVTAEITENSASPAGDVGMDVLFAGDDGASNDVVSTSQYRYAITMVNKDVYSKEVVIDIGSVPAGWYVTLMDEDGTYVGSMGDTITVYGLQTVTYYIAMMPMEAEEGGSVTVPSVNATVSIDGSSQSYELSPATIEVTVDDSGVSGGEAIDERSGIPSGIWFLVAVLILMLIAILWLASKRGVFSRR